MPEASWPRRLLQLVAEVERSLERLALAQRDHLDAIDQELDALEAQLMRPAGELDIGQRRVLVGRKRSSASGCATTGRSSTLTA